MIEIIVLYYEILKELIILLGFGKGGSCLLLLFLKKPKTRARKAVTASFAQKALRLPIHLSSAFVSGPHYVFSQACEKCPL